MFQRHLLRRCVWDTCLKTQVFSSAAGAKDTSVALCPHCIWKWQLHSVTHRITALILTCFCFCQQRKQWNTCLTYCIYDDVSCYFEQHTRNAIKNIRYQSLWDNTILFWDIKTVSFIHFLLFSDAMWKITDKRYSSKHYICITLRVTFGGMTTKICNICNYF